MKKKPPVRFLPTRRPPPSSPPPSPSSPPSRFLNQDQKIRNSSLQSELSSFSKHCDFNLSITIFNILKVFLLSESSSTSSLCRNHPRHPRHPSHRHHFTSFCLLTSFATERSFLRWNNSSSFMLSSST